MPVAHLLEDFADVAPASGETLSEGAIEDLRLAAFEKGYQAGWDDSVKAQRDSSTSLSEDFARNIRDLSFTYHEAYAGFVTAIEPVIGQIVTAVLPELAHATLGVRVAGLLEKLVEKHGRQPVLLVTAPASADALQAVLPGDSGLAVEIRQDATLGEGQVQLRFGDAAECEINLQEVLDGIHAATESFVQQTTPQRKESA